MADREKVIDGIERCMLVTGEVRCKDCPYFNVCCEEDMEEVPKTMLLAALTLLKAQGPRVMTYDEMMKAEICFLEVKGIEEIDPFIRYEVDDKSYWSSPYTNNKDNPFELLAEQEEYLIKARCWTSRPTDEQRAATPWAEPPKEG